jgi:hypothetical protein
MPLYNVACRHPLPQTTRKAVSTAITDTHCGVTDAPPEFVNVIFMHGYSLKNQRRLDIVGGIRTGGNRSAEMIDQLRQALHKHVCAAANLPAHQVAIELIGVEPSWVMEGGMILPEPGAEDDWMQDFKAAKAVKPATS